MGRFIIERYDRTPSITVINTVTQTASLCAPTLYCLLYLEQSVSVDLFPTYVHQITWCVYLRCQALESFVSVFMSVIVIMVVGGGCPGLLYDPISCCLTERVLIRGHQRALYLNLLFTSWWWSPPAGSARNWFFFQITWSLWQQKVFTTGVS